MIDDPFRPNDRPHDELNPPPPSDDDYAAMAGGSFDPDDLRPDLPEIPDSSPSSPNSSEIPNSSNHRKIYGSSKASTEEQEVVGVRLDDFHAYMPAHSYIFAPTGQFWPATSVNARLPTMPVLKRNGEPMLDGEGRPKRIKAAAWLDQNKPVEQMTWVPGEPQIVPDRLVVEGGWIERPGCATFNLYRPPTVLTGDPSKADTWIAHVRRIYPDEADHIIAWLAHRVQRPHEKINHALVLGGAQGIGKDTLLEPVKAAVGAWNFAEVSPAHMLGRFNGFVKSVILRVSEARDLGDIDRFAFYDHMKTYTATPPDVLRVDEKFVREYAVFNVCGVIITSNHKADGIYLPADDRRHYVAWSEKTKADFTPGYWRDLYGWFGRGGIGHVAAYLAAYDLSAFDPFAPPEQTRAFWDIVASNTAPEDAELADALDKLEWPPAITKDDIAEVAPSGFKSWLLERKNNRSIPHRLEEVGYVNVRNRAAKDGQFVVGGKRSAIYARKTLPVRDQIAAAERRAGTTHISKPRKRFSLVKIGEVDEVDDPLSKPFSSQNANLLKNHKAGGREGSEGQLDRKSSTSSTSPTGRDFDGDYDDPDLTY